jgi:site-specific recombinase XerD
MLNDLFQKSHDHHRSLPLLGSVLDDFDDWLFGQGYRYSTRQCYMLRCTAIEEYFWRRKQRSLSVLTPEKLGECWRFYRRRPGGIAGTVRCLQRFLQSRQMLPAPMRPTATAFDATVDAYRQYLSEVRGLAPITIEQHCSTAAELLQHCLGQDGAFRLVDLNRAHIESFVTSVGHRFGRSSMQHVVAHIRGYLRFLSMQGEGPVGLDSQIDTPRVYRLEQLPRALRWETVCAFPESIDRTSVSGLRDYAMFLLIAAYGLRGCDIAGLKLTDLNWRAGELRVNQSKTRSPLRLPLTDPVAQALLDYLREGRPQSAYRELFLTVAAPILPLKRQSAGYAFRFRVKRSGLDIPFRGVHSLRHSYAVHLLRQGVSLKGIGDLLGHRSTESTCVYLRLDLDELREVALPLPALATEERPS